MGKHLEGKICQCLTGFGYHTYDRKNERLPHMEQGLGEQRSGSKKIVSGKSEREIWHFSGRTNGNKNLIYRRKNF